MNAETYPAPLPRSLDDSVRTEIERVGTEMVRTRRGLHAHPELAFQEFETAHLVARRCAALGYEVRTGVGGTGVLADLAGGAAGPTVLVRADMDALPIQSGNDGRPYRSTRPGVMHACGHDGHVAIALGVADALATLRTSWSGRVRLCFQPAEETDAGAERMIADGALASVDRAVGLHLTAGMPLGSIGVGSDVQWAGSDELRLCIAAEGGHAGMPDGRHSAIEIAARVILALRDLPERIEHRAPIVVSIAQIGAGAATNVVASEVELTGTVRAVDESDRQRLHARIQQTVDRVVRECGGSMRLTFGTYCPPVECHPETTERIRAALRRAFPSDAVVPTDPTTACDDMARYLREVPGCYFRVGASDLAAGPAYPHHHPLFDLDERALSIGAEALTRAVLALLRV